MDSMWQWPQQAPMIGETRQLVTTEAVEFEKWLVEVEDYMKITDHFRLVNHVNRLDL